MVLRSPERVQVSKRNSERLNRRKCECCRVLTVYRKESAKVRVKVGR